MSFAERTSFPSQQYRRIAGFIGQRILSHTSFPYCGSEKSYCMTVRPNRLPASVTTAKRKLLWYQPASSLVRLTWVIWGDPFPQPTPSKEYVLRTFPQFKVILFYARNLKLIYVGTLGTIIGVKLCHSVTLSRLNISYVDGTPVVQKG